MPNGYRAGAPVRVPCILRGYSDLVGLAAAVWCSSSLAAEPARTTALRQDVKPVLTHFCIGCHNAEANKGNVSFESAEPATALLENRDLWWKALKMLRAGIMPPRNKPRPTPDQIRQVETWIKYSAFGI